MRLLVIHDLVAESRRMVDFYNADVSDGLLKCHIKELMGRLEKALVAVEPTNDTLERGRRNGAVQKEEGSAIEGSLPLFAPKRVGPIREE